MRPNIERLHRLARLVERLKPQDINLDSWAKCPFGYAARDPWFCAEGLTFQFNPEEGEYEPYYYGFFGWDAILIFFNIDWDTALDIASLVDNPSSDIDIVRNRLQRVIQQASENQAV